MIQNFTMFHIYSLAFCSFVCVRRISGHTTRLTTPEGGLWGHNTPASHIALVYDSRRMRLHQTVLRDKQSQTLAPSMDQMNK